MLMLLTMMLMWVIVSRSKQLGPTVKSLKRDHLNRLDYWQTTLLNQAKLNGVPRVFWFQNQMILLDLRHI